MNFSAGLSLLTKLVLKKFGLSIWVPYWFIDTNIRHCKFQQPGYYDFNAVTFSNYITHTGKPVVGVSPIGMELMFSEYILGQYLALTRQTKIWCDLKEGRKTLRKNMKSC